MVHIYLLSVALFSAVTLSAQGFQVVITELMPDPELTIHLPPEEFIELTNVSGKTIDISGWQLSNGRTISRFPDSLQLPADSVLIICASRSVEQFSNFGSTLGLSRFPSLSNSGDTIFLFNQTGDIVHAVAYNLMLYGTDQAPGGRSLEMIDLKISCSLQNNWSPSISINGGTPGQLNSYSDEPKKEQHFTLLHAFCMSDTTLTLVFDNRIDLTSASKPGAIQTEPTQQFSSVKVAGVLGNQLLCTLKKPLLHGQLMEIGADGISSCLQDPTGGIRRVKSGLQDTGEIRLIINEVLFNPPPMGSDYVELFNASNKVMNLQNLAFATRNNNGEITIPKNATLEPRFFYPGEYLVFTQNPDWLSGHFLVKDPSRIIYMESLPSWANEKGTLILLNKSGVILDELKYSDDWHFPLLRNHEGIALERKNPAAITQDSSNWFSAAMTAGYGTPGYSNSQSMTITTTKRQVWITPSIFSPNGDGQDDESHLRYQFDQVGFMLTAKIYNRSGRLMRTLVNNGLCGLEGSYSWDGLDDKKNQLPANIYIVVTDIFSLDGQVRKFRSAVTLGY